MAEVMEFIAIVVGVVLGNVIWDFIKEQRSYKYKWECPVCDQFEASASSEDIIERIKTGHTHEE